MAGQVRTGAYPTQLPLTTNPQLTYDRAFPDIPQGYATWNDYVLAVLNAVDQGELGPRALNVYGQDILGDMQPLEFLTNNLGYGKLAPILDQSNPRIQTFLDSTHYSNTSHDAYSFFGDQFSTALLGLGLATGGASLYGAFSAPAAEGAALGAAEAGFAAGAPDVVAPITLEAGANIAATPTLTAPSTGGLSLKSVLGYASAAKSAAQFAQDPSLENALKAVGSAVGATGMEFADYASLATALAGAGASAYGMVQNTNAASSQGAIAQQQADLAMQLFAAGAPMRGLTGSQLYHFMATGGIPQAMYAPPASDYGLTGFMQGGGVPAALQPAALPSVPDMTAANRDVLESQFNVARDRTIEQAPVRGGALNAALGDLEAQRALGVTGLYAKQNELQYQQDLAEAQRQNQQNQQLFGVGLDLEREKAQRDQALRNALFASAIGSGYNTVGPALTGLSQASAGFGNVATQGLGVANMGLKAGMEGLEALLYNNRTRNQRTAGSAPVSGGGYGF